MPFDSPRSAFAELAVFLCSEAEALQNAALLLGGRPALRRTQRLLDDMTTAPRLTQRLAREVSALHDLLTLENVGDPERLETAYFDEIDPASAVVEDICLAADRLEDLMTAACSESGVCAQEPLAA
ncbi:hypothetical protein [Tranquillimonas alkanivorans]|uniref:DUF47 family protein n=1 Tax=Tranquillimonas alkanivorans TaxID=441119 RepID=A0A1I5VY50_9RHOB|nr:hypothetical protein [Tranquillimonas alkanivorans]SFQ12399.1 hypothetical protein SAMN04488047_13724 [Tranquillimonas alkanivorans]